MLYPSPRRGRHRKRISALRLSDSSVTPLPAYTSPPWSRPPELHGDLSDRPPDYPDSAEEADADTDSEDDNVVYVPAPHQLPVTPRRTRQQFNRTSTSRRLQCTSDDSYLDSLLARSVDALEMSNALLQSSMSTQSSLSAVLADDSVAERSLEARAQHLSTRINGNQDLHNFWMDDLAKISKNVDNLVAEEPEEEGAPQGDTVSKSLPASPGFAEHARKQGRHTRRPSLDLRNTSSAHLEYSNHERSHFISPAPRALTMYIDSSDEPDIITLPSTLGLRSSSHLPPTPLPSTETATAQSSDHPHMEPVEQTRRAVDVLSSYITRSAPCRSSIPSSVASVRLPFTRSRRSSSTSSYTIRRPGQSKSPPPTSKSVTSLTPSSSPSTSFFHARSLTPLRTSSPPRLSRPMTPPIEELSTSSTSDSSEMHVERTLESLRNILDKQRSVSSSKSPSGQRTALRPALLFPPSVTPISGTSTATASVSRLFTKARHSSSTRPPSPPQQSSLKNHSIPPTPLTSTAPSSSSSMLSIADALVGRARTASSSGRSTPKRISFAELPESYASSKPKGASPFKGKVRAKRDKGKGRADARDEDAEYTGWWTGWLMGAAGTGSASGLSLGAAREERFARSSSWNVRPAFGGSLEEWGA